MLPRTREVGAKTTNVAKLITGVCSRAHGKWAGPIEYKLSRGEGGSSDRSSPRRPYPQCPQCHPRVAKGASGRSLARLPCPQVLQRHSGVAKGTSIDPLARGPSTEPLLGQGQVARLSGTGVKPVSCRCFGRSSARHPRREASRWHLPVAKRVF